MKLAEFEELLTKMERIASEEYQGHPLNYVSFSEGTISFMEIDSCCGGTDFIYSEDIPYEIVDLLIEGDEEPLRKFYRELKARKEAEELRKQEAKREELKRDMERALREYQRLQDAYNKG